MKKILVSGGNGQLGRALQNLPHNPDYQIICAPKSQLDITDPACIEKVLEAEQPQFVINTAAYTAVDQAEEQKEIVFSVNRDGAKNIAHACEKFNIPLLHVSTDYVFDGSATEPYQEDHRTAPINNYGQSKWEGEQAVREQCPQHIILRTSGVFGYHGANFVKTIAAHALEKKQLSVVCDQTICPTPAHDIATTCVNIALSIMQSSSKAAMTHWGTYHYSSNHPVSWHEFATAITDAYRELQSLRVEKIDAISTDQFPTLATRPKYTVLCCDKIASVFNIHNRSWQEGLNDTLRNLANA